VPHVAINTADVVPSARQEPLNWLESNSEAEAEGEVEAEAAHARYIQMKV
jgi:hypothetical protein